MRIRLGNRSITRITGQGFAPVSQADWESASALQAMFVKANYSWEDPLSASSFSAWRHQLAQKEDLVSQPDNASYLIQTSSSTGEIATASLRLATADLHAVESTLAFRNHESVEITDLGAAVPTPNSSLFNTSPLTPNPPQATQAPAAGLAPASSSGSMSVSSFTPFSAARGWIIVLDSVVPRQHRGILANDWYTIPLGAVHKVGRVALAIYGMDKAGQQLEKVWGDKLPDWARDDGGKGKPRKGQQPKRKPQASPEGES